MFKQWHRKCVYMYTMHKTWSIYTVYMQKTSTSVKLILLYTNSNHLGNAYFLQHSHETSVTPLPFCSTATGPWQHLFPPEAASWDSAVTSTTALQVSYLTLPFLAPTVAARHWAVLPYTYQYSISVNLVSVFLSVQKNRTLTPRFSSFPRYSGRTFKCLNELQLQREAMIKWGSPTWEII